MKKIFWGFVLLAAFSACNNKAKEAQQERDALDSLTHEPLDTAELAEVEEAPMPKAADELFDDFIYNFVKNHRLQKERVKFPLTVTENGVTTKLKKGEWKHDKLFADSEIYIVLYDKVSQAALEKDTSVSKACVEWLSLDTHRVKKYNFARTLGQWMLMSVSSGDIAEADGSEFLKFYNHFVTDSAYQASHVNEPLTFSAPDPDDEFETIDGTLDVEQWFAFRPQMPAGGVWCINYGQHLKNGSQKVLMMKGVSNSMEAVFTFKKFDGEWKLAGYEN